MKWLLCLVVATILIAFAVSARPSVTLDPMNWSALIDLDGPVYQVATKKDLLAYADYSNLFPVAKRGFGQSLPVTAIRRRNSEGVYEPVGNFPDYATYLSTNGKWVALYKEGVVLFNIDSNNVISNSSELLSVGGYLLSDDTFIGYDPSLITNTGGLISTFQYNASDNSWNIITELGVPITTANAVGDYASYRATDTHLVFADFLNLNSTDVVFKIYSRQADKSWTLDESVPINSTYGMSSNVNYNGVDTIVYSSFTFLSLSDEGILFIKTKINGQWTEQIFTIEDLGYRPQGALGAVTTFLDANTLVVTAGLDGYDGTNLEGAFGKVLIMTRNTNGLWEPSIDLNNPSAGLATIWGLAVGVNDYDIVVPLISLPDASSLALALTFYTAPRCLAQPPNVTCNEIQVNDCTQLNVSSLYTVNNPQCGDVTATLTGLGLVDNKAVKAQISFSKKLGLGTAVSCSATVTCPAPPLPPVTIQQQTPSKVSSAVLKSGLAPLMCLGFMALFA